MKSINKLLALLCVLALMSTMVVWASATDVGEAAEVAAPVETPTDAEQTVDEITPLEDISPEDYPTLSSWAQKEIISLYSKGAVPDALMSHFTTAITRAEFTAIIVLAYEAITLTAVEAAGSAFTDTADNTYSDYIEKAYTLGIIDGRSPEIFDPDSSITRQEAAKILYSFASAIGRADEPESFTLAYPDAGDISDWAMPYVCYAFTNGLMQGTGTAFNPLGSLTREQSMAIIERLWMGSSGLVIPDSEPALPDPVYRALVVGVDDYKEDSQDGERFAVSVNEYNQHFQNLEVNGSKYHVTAASNILGAQFFTLISTTFAEADDDDVSVFMLTCHGVSGGSFGPEDYDRAKFVLSDGSINDGHYFSSLVDAMRPIKGIKVLIVGSCFSGGMAMMAPGEDNILILTACAIDEESHGIILTSSTYNVFERAVIVGLGYEGSLKADYDNDGAVTFDELAKYVKYDVANGFPGTESEVQIKSGVNVVLATGVLSE